MSLRGGVLHFLSPALSRMTCALCRRVPRPGNRVGGEARIALAPHPPRTRRAGTCHNAPQLINAAHRPLVEGRCLELPGVSLQCEMAPRSSVPWRTFEFAEIRTSHVGVLQGGRINSDIDQVLLKVLLGLILAAPAARSQRIKRSGRSHDQ